VLLRIRRDAVLARPGLPSLSQSILPPFPHPPTPHPPTPLPQERYTLRINKIMAGEPDFQPLNPHGGDLWKAVSDGKWLCRFLNKCQPAAVDEALFTRKLTGPMAKLEAANGINPWANTETLNSFLEAARVVGMEFGAVGATDFSKADADHKEHIVLGVLWQLLRRQLANEIKELLVRQQEEAEAAAAATGSATSAAEAAAAKEALSKVLKDPETFLCEWVNATLAEHGLPEVRAGAISELSTSSTNILVQLVHAMDASESSTAGLEQEDPTERANALVGWAAEHGIPSLSQAEDLRDGNPRLILPYVMGVFTWYHTHKSNKDGHGSGDATLSSVWVVRQHWHVTGETPSCTSNTIVAFKREDEALRYVLAENMTLVGTDPELPHLLTLAQEYAASVGYEEESVLASLGPIPEVLNKPDDVEEDDAEKLRGELKGRRGHGMAAAHSSSHTPPRSSPPPPTPSPSPAQPASTASSSPPPSPLSRRSRTRSPPSSSPTPRSRSTRSTRARSSESGDREGQRGGGGGGGRGVNAGPAPVCGYYDDAARSLSRVRRAFNTVVPRVIESSLSPPSGPGPLKVPPSPVPPPPRLAWPWGWRCPRAETTTRPQRPRHSPSQRGP
jgi:hypothetical protein